MQHYQRYIALILLLFCASSVHADPARKKITFMCSLATSLPAYREFEDRYRQAFAAMGYDFSMISASTQRALIDANNGTADGDCARTDYFLTSEQTSNLLKVDVKMTTTELSAWSHDPNLKLHTASELKNSPLKIGYPRGHLMSDKFMADNGLTPHLLTTDTNIAIKMLSARRYDVLLASTDMVNQYLPGIHLRQKIYKVGVLQLLDIYPFMNKKHQALIPQFTEELRKLVPPEGIPIEGRKTE